MSTCKERQAKRRAKIKQNKELYQAYLEKDKKSNKACSFKVADECTSVRRTSSKGTLAPEKISRKEKVEDSAEYTDGKWPAINKHSIPYLPVFGEGCEVGTGFPTILST